MAPTGALSDVKESLLFRMTDQQCRLPDETISLLNVRGFLSAASASDTRIGLDVLLHDTPRIKPEARTESAMPGQNAQEYAADRHHVGRRLRSSAANCANAPPSLGAPRWITHVQGPPVGWRQAAFGSALVQLSGRSGIFMDRLPDSPKLEVSLTGPRERAPQTFETGTPRSWTGRTRNREIPRDDAGAPLWLTDQSTNATRPKDAATPIASDQRHPLRN